MTLGCAERATACDFVVCTVSCTLQRRFRSLLPWRPHLRNIPLEWSMVSETLLFPRELVLDHHNRHHHHNHQSIHSEGLWGTTDDFATSFFHFYLFPTALWDLANSRPVHLLMLSSHLPLCLPCLLPPFTVPRKMVWPDLMNGRQVNTTAICVSLRWSGLRVVRLPAGFRRRLPRWKHLILPLSVAAIISVIVLPLFRFTSLSPFHQPLCPFRVKSPTLPRRCQAFFLSRSTSQVSCEIAWRRGRTDRS